MKLRLLLFMLFILFLYESGAQTFYTENFNNGCTANCLATSYAGWTVTDNVGGTTGSAPNNWFISCAEEGVAPPGCGSSCVGDACLHIGANAGAGGDQGSTYNETGAVNATYRRAVSPSISTVGRTNIVLQFDFIAYGSASCSEDRAQLHLSDNNGASWPVAYQFCLSSLCCGACNGYSQGQWTTYSYTLPASFNNNAGIRIGFHWRNNGNGSGTDPSVAIDDIRLTQISPLPVTLVDFMAEKHGNVNRLNWKSVQEQQFSHFEIERSEDGIQFSKIGMMAGKGNALGKISYSFEDKQISPSVIYYYRLKLVDKDASFSYSRIVTLEGGGGSNDPLQLVKHLVYNHQLKLELTAKQATSVRMSVYDSKGKAVIPAAAYNLKSGANFVDLDISGLSQAMYFLKVERTDHHSTNDPVITLKFVKSEY